MKGKRAMIKGYLGVDVGSVSTNVVVIGEDGSVLARQYLRTNGRPIETVQRGVSLVGEEVEKEVMIVGSGTTGSARYLSSMIIGADIVKNEITAHAVAALAVNPEVQTIIEIGGQDSKIIILRDGVVIDFAMNTVCAAGTGSFLDQQAARLRIPIEEFGDFALKAKNPVRIAGRCAVFAESDMIHKQQLGYNTEDIIAGLCEALVRNYLNNVGKGKEILPPVLFQGGVAANRGLVKAFEKYLGMEVIVPENYDVMGAVGAALLAKEAVARKRKTAFKGFRIGDVSFRTTSFECKGCSNLCEVVQFYEGEELVARWGDRCGRWEVQAS
ncbi:acyl-CoA dehydratase activase [Syntrophothermus lipocalidus]|uniref:CoA-substrate-specific enzyme activase n=1 Tax=Syntrophothermus lipocalidus (strain DSM 12680 / TGB-C1) TaxID=643648 RepID=D7CKB5_SYNLT|nr:acyl-CoA dehydratase activase [Syntrophothermus lipocalidus]ADI03099.1 CoA-substrate-specific enzyme activase [Syntrophothermus lipocalidus DSM 12680]HOV42381.1 acyl-CoA dehydratase activase [Syntrophothermus lipocalidus]